MGAVLRLIRGIARPCEIGFPVERAPKHRLFALGARRDVAGCDVLAEDAGATFERSSCDEGARSDIETERIVGVGRIDHDSVHDAARFGQRSSPHGFRRRLVDRLALVEKRPGVEAEAVRCAVLQAREGPGALRGSECQVVRRVVESVGVGPGMVVVVRPARIGGIVDRRAGHAVVQGAIDELARVRVVENDASLGGESAAVGDAGARFRPTCQCLIGGAHAPLIGVAQMN